MTRNTKGPATLEPGELDESSDPFWSERSLEQLAADQGVAPINHLEDAWARVRGCGLMMKTSRRSWQLPRE